MKRMSAIASTTTLTRRAPSMVLVGLLGLLGATSSGCESSPESSETCPEPTTAPPVPSTAGPLTSVSRISFGAPDVLFVADWKASKVFAFELPAASGAADGKSFNIKNMEATLSKTLGDTEIALEDVVARPGSNEVYFTVSVGALKTPALVMAKADGSMSVVDLGKAPQTSATLADAPDEKLMFWNTIPGRSFTVTDMKWYDGKLYVAGLSNQAFSSTLRVFDYPFGTKSAMASVEMYHTAHDQMETRAPIRAMQFVQLGGKPHLLAVYLCTPVVTIPVEEITDGAHIVAKTIAEIGNAGIPIGVVPYSAKNPMTGIPGNFVLLANSYRESVVVPLASVEEANLSPGYSMPVVPANKLTGLAGYGATLSPVYRIANQDDNFFIVLRRDLQTGQSELLSYSKAVLGRLSDADVSEFSFSDYQYDAKHEFIRQVQNAAKINEGYPELVR